jgi:nucleotide-binding universal stress UspA family protein
LGIAREANAMTPFHRILVPTDFGTHSERAVALALGMAKVFDASVVLLHALDLAQKASALASTSGTIVPLDFGEGPARHALETALSDACGLWPRTEAILRRGVPSEEILRAAGDVGADLIVMGTHGRRGVFHALVGSVTEKIVRASLVPVLTVRGD